MPAKRETACRMLVLLLALMLLAAAALLVLNSRLRPFDASQCVRAPDCVVWEIEKFEKEATLVVTGWAYDAQMDYPGYAVFAVLKDASSGTCYLIPTAARPVSAAACALVPQEYRETGGFFARGVSVFQKVAGYELCLLYTDGLNEYLIETGSFA